MRKKKEKKIIGWREWIDLPDLGIKGIKAKVDTGARSSALHAYDLKIEKSGRKEYAKFKVHPDQDDNKKFKKCRAEIIEYRKVKSSNGQTELRPVIMSTVFLHNETWETEITLTNRDQMGFRMLLGRASFKRRYLVDVSKSYLGTKK